MRWWAGSLVSAVLLSVATAARAEGDAPAPHQVNEERDRDPLGPWVPDYARLQTGGFVGVIAAGFGYAIFDDVLNITLLYGYTPDEASDVHALELSANVRPFELVVDRARIVPIYLGFGTLATWGNRYYLDLPEQYPSGYYLPNALQPVLYLGTEAGWATNGVVERQSLFFEVKTLANYALRYMKNPEVVDFEDIVAGCVGYRIAF